MKKISLALAALVLSVNAFAGVPGWRPQLPEEGEVVENPRLE